MQIPRSSTIFVRFSWILNRFIQNNFKLDNFFFIFQSLVLSKIVLLWGISTFSTIYESYYFGDPTKWIRTKQGSPVYWPLLVLSFNCFMIGCLSQRGSLKSHLFQTSFSGHNYAFGCDGRTFGLIRTHDPTLLNSIVQKGKIFARMLPEQKIHLIECMKDLG